eukprot:gene18273-24882_t
MLLAGSTGTARPRVRGSLQNPAAASPRKHLPSTAPSAPPLMPTPPHARPVPLDKAYRLLNHGPTVLVSAAHA